MELRPGTLNLFILQSLAGGPRHGYAITAWLRDASGGELAIEEGALYHALHRMERGGWLTSETRPSDANRQARYYRLTPAGRRELSRETQSWRRYVAIAERLFAAGRRQP